jgi:hypothetical protein
MTRTISLIIGIALAALVAVPTAFGEGRLAGSQEPNGVAYFYANERATLAQQPTVVDRRTDAFDRNPVVEQSAYVTSEHSVPARPDVSTYLDANERSTVPSTPSVTPSSTGDGIEWPQIGIGFGIGIALAIVLGLSLKATRPRTLAH